MGAYDTAATDRLRRELDSEGSCFGMDSVLEVEEGDWGGDERREVEEGDWGGGERRDLPGEFSGRGEGYEEALEELQGLRHEIQYMENTLQILKPVSGRQSIHNLGMVITEAFTVRKTSGGSGSSDFCGQFLAVRRREAATRAVTEGSAQPAFPAQNWLCCAG
jgi:hypothetical protein